MYRRVQCLRSDNARGDCCTCERALVCVISWLWERTGGRRATVSPLCGFYEIEDVCKLDLLSNATCGITLYRRGSSIFISLLRKWQYVKSHVLYCDTELFHDALLTTTVLSICCLFWFSVHKPLYLGTDRQLHHGGRERPLNTVINLPLPLKWRSSWIDERLSVFSNITKYK